MDISVIKGDTWSGKSFQIDLNGSPLDLSGATFLFQIKKNATDDTPVLSLEPTITDASGGEFSILPQIIDIPARAYVYDLQITSLDGAVRTVLSGTFTVTQDVSR